MFKSFYPDCYMNSTYEIDFDTYYEKGYRGVIFDIDNTLVPHGAPADERSQKLFAHLKELGFKVVLLSNNKEPRVKMFNDVVKVSYIHNILVKPIDKKEEIQIVLKRYLEKIVLASYNRYMKKQGRL